LGITVVLTSGIGIGIASKSILPDAGTEHGVLGAEFTAAASLSASNGPGDIGGSGDVALSGVGVVSACALVE
jgi:hypothetical protein